MEHFMKRRQSADIRANRKRQALPANEDQSKSGRAQAIAFLHRTLGNRTVSRLLGGSAPRTATHGSPAIQRQKDSEYITRMKEAFRKAGITQEMITGERSDGFIDYDEEKGVAKWVPITFIAPVPKLSREAEKARMMEAFRKAGITEEMIRGERSDGVIDYDEETGVARWLPIVVPAVPVAKPDSKDEIARMKEAFRKGGITEEMIRGERSDGVIIYDEATGTARWEKITFHSMPSDTGASKKRGKN
jgi:hypothetical protein